MSHRGQDKNSGDGGQGEKGGVSERKEVQTSRFWDPALHVSGLEAVGDFFDNAFALIYRAD